ncbi:conserved hypothetical protein [Leishmania mexicana MHOM/GT/2001/U1103]|uniref:Uncharacterized protein n=1 Tax=Leishmania mexicana (strain MHOM/GT/2001/U1103) TaxID=929439 RepID=E9AJH6_LEIMU|nr:conserved hypothetical protein [Leishmania mexicana MHOM/GT/2001/U1103]CBZ23074.1 conserved hypothetical protein [Leishmania mexicana MHOM/GT/2001/U1103]
MPAKTGGFRKLAEEKALLSDLSKMLHIIKANHKEQRNGREAVAAAAAASTAAANAASLKASKKTKPDTRRGSQRRSQHGGSVWIVLKGGFSPKSVPTAMQTEKVDTRASGRALLSEKRRAAALKEAEAYIESAWQQAKEAELLTKDGVPTEGGDAYLAEQYALASRMLCPPTTGAHLHQLVASHCSSGLDDAVTGVAHGQPEYTLTRSEWEDICTREAAILFRYRTSATPAGTAEDYFRAQQQARENFYHFATAEPMTKAGDIVPTKCFVRIRDSQRDKHTCVLRTAKSVNYFKSNFGQVLRKELSASRLPRGGAADEGDAATSAHAGKGNHQVTPQSGAAAHHSNSGKKKRRR